MFDVPVPDVTVSSAQIFISGIGQTNQITLKTSPFASALLNALPVSPQIDRSPSSTTVETSQADVTHTRTLLPNGKFQQLQPLNLAAATQSLTKVLEIPLDDLPAQLTSIRTASTSESSGTTSATAAVPSTNVASISSSSAPEEKLQATSAIAPPEKPISTLPTKELRHCIDIPFEANPTGAATLQVWLQGSLIGEVSALNSPEEMARSLQDMLADEPFNPNQITPVFNGNQPAIRLGSDLMLHVLPQTTARGTEVGEETTDVTQSPLGQEWTAIVWSDQLRRVMGAPPLDAGEVQVLLKELKPSEQTLDGVASWYGPYFHGRQTANGEIFDQNALTAAHKTLPFDTVLQVRNVNNNRTVVVRINDRGPYIGKRSLDLSKAAAQCLGSEDAGVISYEAVILEQKTANAPIE